MCVGLLQVVYHVCRSVTGYHVCWSVTGGVPRVLVCNRCTTCVGL